MSINWIRDPVYGYRMTDYAMTPVERRVFAPLHTENPRLHEAIVRYPRPVDLHVVHRVLGDTMQMDWMCPRSLAKRTASIPMDDLRNEETTNVLVVRLMLDATC